MCAAHPNRHERLVQSGPVSPKPCQPPSPASPKTCLPLHTANLLGRVPRGGNPSGSGCLVSLGDSPQKSQPLRPNHLISGHTRPGTGPGTARHPALVRAQIYPPSPTSAVGPGGAFNLQTADLTTTPPPRLVHHDRYRRFGRRFGSVFPRPRLGPLVPPSSLLRLDVCVVRHTSGQRRRPYCVALAAHAHAPTLSSCCPPLH